MNGEIAMTIGLVLAANARKRGISCPRWPDASIYQFCNKVTFTGRRRGWALIPGSAREAGDPNVWLDTLPPSMTSARLCVLRRDDPQISDRESAGFANSGPIFAARIEASKPEAWHAEWQVTKGAAADRRIWSVAYRNVPDIGTGLEPRSQQDVRDALYEVLDEAVQFSGLHHMAFAESFVSAQRALDDSAPLRDFYHKDMIPEDMLALGDMQLFGCAARAWVFGGMGSWNDVWFEGDDRDIYRDLSDRLFWTIIEALVVATNASRGS